MNVIIPLAGHSRRFHAAGHPGPKAFLTVGDRPMIDHAVAMFSPDDAFHFVMTHQQAADPAHVRHLESLGRFVRVITIDAHELGPVHSARQVPGLAPDDEVIVAYCDFTVRWDYARFLREARDGDAVVPCFRGFHPASFGDTYYAYVRADGLDFAELREKQSFTERRHEEFASTGIYYFRRWADFEAYGREVLDGDKDGLAEAYVSLLLNPMKRDGRRVRVFPVDAFICLGTPEDVEQYQFWYDVFHADPPRPAPGEQTNLIPMAGGGARFKRAGFTQPKPLVPVGGEPMFQTACRSFPPTRDWVFLGPRSLEPHVGPGARFVAVDELTSGQAATCLRAVDRLDPEKPLLIASCDYRTDWDVARWRALVDDPSVDVAVWTFRLRAQLCANYDAFAYCRTDADGRVTEIVEKKTISDDPRRDPMVVGTFWYRRGENFITAARATIAKDVRVNGEHYVGVSINELIGRGLKVVIFDVDRWVSFGDPFEREVYEYWRHYFRGGVS